MTEFYGVSLTMVMIDISLILVGFFIKKTKSAELIAGFDIKKDEKNKEFLADLFGRGLMLMGIISTIETLIFVVITNQSADYIVKRNTLIFITIIVLNIILGSSKLYYIMHKKKEIRLKNILKYKNS